MRVKSEKGEIFIIFRLGDTLPQIENEIIDLVLANNDGNKSKAALALKMNRTTLVEKLKARLRRGY